MNAEPPAGVGQQPSLSNSDVTVLSLSPQMTFWSMIFPGLLRQK